MTRLRFPTLALPSLLVLTPIVLLVAAPAARADIAPTCDEEASLITCAAADVGKPCQGAGKCYAVSCSATTPPSTATTEYKCDACPTVLTTSSVTCSAANLQTACGDGATCMVLSAWCTPAGATNKYACAMPAAAPPTGPPTGETGAGGAGGASTTGAAGASTTGAAGASTTGAAGASTTGAAGAGTTGAAGASATGAAGSGTSTTGTGGTSAISGGGGCTIGGAQTTAGIAGGLLVIGLGFLSLSRRRRPR